MSSQTSTHHCPPSLSQPKHDDIRTRVWMEHGHLVREHTQPSRKAVLEEVQARRNDPEGVIDMPGLGRCVLTIPQLDFKRLCRLRPDLISADGHTQTKAWQKFMKHSDSEPYRNVRRI